MRDWFPQIWNGTLREHYLQLFSVAGALALIVGGIGAWFGARFGSRRVVREVMDALPTFDQQQLANQQLARLSQAVDVMAVEIERLSEGQRFTAKLLAERASNQLPKTTERAPGVVTPH